LAVDGGEWSASHPGCFYPWGRASHYPLDRRLGGYQSHSGCGGEENKVSAPTRNGTLVIPPIT